MDLPETKSKVRPKKIRPAQERKGICIRRVCISFRKSETFPRSCDAHFIELLERGYTGPWAPRPPPAILSTWEWPGNGTRVMDK